MNQLNENSSGNVEKDFPRKLNDNEKRFILSVLPENKPGYKAVWENIKDLYVIGFGNFGSGDLILGNKEDKPDRSGPSSPVFAVGTIKYSELEIDIIIHEQVENNIEVEISYSNNEQNLNKLSLINQWSYSDWSPGKNAPGDNSIVREVVLVSDMYIIAIAPKHKRLWVHDYNTGVNHLIPVSNFYNHLMIVKGIKKSDAVFKPALLFQELDTFTSNEIISAFLLYNKYLKHIDLDYSLFNNDQKNKIEKKKIFKLFKRG